VVHSGLGVVVGAGVVVVGCGGLLVSGGPTSTGGGPGWLCPFGVVVLGSVDGAVVVGLGVLCGSVVGGAVHVDVGESEVDGGLGNGGTGQPAQSSVTCRVALPSFAVTVSES
jgi:hypothetical protein